MRLESLEGRDLLAGVTLITHGFGGHTDGWVSTMANAIVGRTEHSEQPRYIVEVTDPGELGGPLTVQQALRTGPSVTELSNPELMILLDWSDVAGSFFSTRVRNTFDVAEVVAEALTDPNLLDDLGGSIARLPLHLIGHSRGGSLVGELAHQLGELGVWVNQVTTLDPHPVDGVRDPFGQDYGDAPMLARENVVFWDNYWRTDGDSSLDFTGEAVANTLNVQLDESVLNDNEGYFNEHSDVHLWYHGTIDTDGDFDDGSESVSADAGWFEGNMGPRHEIGYYYRRQVGGNRPTAGLSAAVGGSANRSSITDHSSDAWPSLVELQVTSSTTLPIGTAIQGSFYWHDHNGNATISYFLDTDRNPLNGTGQSLGEAKQLGLNVTNLAERNFSASTSGTTTGDYYLLAVISDGDNTRFEHSNTLLTLTAQPTITFESTTVQGNVLGASVGTVQVSGLGDSYSLTINDSRFVFASNELRLRDDASLSGDNASNVTLRITATPTDSSATALGHDVTISIEANPFAWRNPANPLDANNDGSVAPIDALVIINRIHDDIQAKASGQLPTARHVNEEFYFDTNGDGFTAPIDVLLVINFIDDNPVGEGESAIAILHATCTNANTQTRMTPAICHNPVADFARLGESTASILHRRPREDDSTRSTRTADLFSSYVEWEELLPILHIT